MTVKELHKILEENGVDEINFSGKCHDCGIDVDVLASLEDGLPRVEGGSVYKVVPPSARADNIFIKCMDCFAKDPVLRNWRKTEVYSRIVGYLRPVEQWNKGKQAEWGRRRVYKTG